VDADRCFVGHRLAEGVSLEAQVIALNPEFAGRRSTVARYL